MTDETPAGVVPVRRVSMTVTGYLRHGHPVSGFYDMQTAAGGGMAYSIPESAVDESSVRDAPPETLTADDWSEIHGHVAARFGPDRAAGIVAQFQRAIDTAATPWTVLDDEHPGATLRARLAQIGMRQAELARRTGLSTKHVNQVIKGAIGISADVAILLERETGVPALVWNRLDADWRGRRARARLARGDR